MELAATSVNNSNSAMLLLDHDAGVSLSATILAESYQAFRALAAEGIESPALQFYIAFSDLQTNVNTQVLMVATVPTKEEAIKTAQEEELVFVQLY